MSNAITPDGRLPYPAFAPGSVASEPVTITRDDPTADSAGFERTAIRSP
ncbi:hypothetical protein KUH32_11815 [Thalassococcus sp. CAU 1522]|uniref:Uncharacterized protein n=1 Tax=Thalassococcus arenae TaxID=2851652 RepID=A0ABS6N9J4_9RHOB|nr:hypothetical protein [Thalassococcus arenae]MBV2360463.1 hypothetical protein [Thalassococcus arenae]